MINTTYLYYFSPTGGTKKVGELFSNGISKNIKKINLGLRDAQIENPQGDLTVIAVPVFGGRIPDFTTSQLKQINGKGKKAVTLVVYGNRAYEDALLELNNVVKAQGFQILASAAFVAQHSMAPEVGKGRPDEQDKKEIIVFAKKVLSKIEANDETTVEVPGNYPYKEAKGMPVTPISLKTCHLCGKCEKACPTGAIIIKNQIVETDADKCMLCMACTAVCPEHARILPMPVQEKMEQMLGTLKTVCNENQFFI